MKEEMASYKSKMEKMSKTPAASKIKTYNEEVSTSSNAIENRLEALKSLRSEISNKKSKY
jgi:tetrahydromethanopterin S-methyltransferase subunit F